MRQSSSRRLRSVGAAAPYSGSRWTIIAAARQCPRAAGAASLGRDLMPVELLRLAEIVLDAFGQRGPVELDDALVALGVLALVDGEGEIAGAEQPGHGDVRRVVAAGASATASFQLSNWA